MENYSDIDESNWLYASDTNTNASASITIRSRVTARFLYLTGANANYLFESESTGTPDPGEMYIGSTVAQFATNTATVINTSASADFSASYAGGVVTIYAATAGADGNLNSLSSN